MRIAVLGVGLIGGSIGLVARGDGAEVVGFGRRPLDRALELGAVDRAAGSVAEAVEGADVCFVCAPVAVLPELVGKALSAASETCVVTDVGSTKRELAAATADDERFIGGHPIAGAETAGVEHARPTLFHGATWYLTPGERSSGLMYERLHSLIASFGASPVAIDAETHDRLLAAVSHLPHVVANVIVSQVAERLRRQGEALPRVGPSFRDATRVAGANSAIWKDIYLSNADAIADEVDTLVETLRDISGWLRSAAADPIVEWNEQAAADRRALLEAELAGGPVAELRVSVPNRPGIVAQVALALGRAGVNIADMALAPAPDFRSGSMTLYVTGDGAAERATELIEDLGFPVAGVP
jgi:prephenate dehydrogenase